MDNRDHKLFISHASHDEQYVRAFVELLEDIGMKEGEIVCTSVPGHGIPGGEKIYEWLRKQFTEFDLRVVFVLSKNYYDSIPCLNEMGAAWVTKASFTLLLLPGFDFNDIKGCIDPTEIGIKLDSNLEELNHRLNELKDVLTEEYQLSAISQTRWERYRNDFVKKILDLNSQTDNLSEERAPLAVQIEDSTCKRSDLPMSEEACIMLLFAADGDGRIEISRGGGGSTYLVGGKYNMNENQTPREIAKWNDAAQALLQNGYIEPVNSKKDTQSFQVTHNGYTQSDAFKKIHRLDTNNNTPTEVLELLRIRYSEQENEQIQQNDEIEQYMSFNPYH